MNKRMKAQPSYIVGHTTKTYLSATFRHDNSDYATVEVSREESDYDGETVAYGEHYDIAIDDYEVENHVSIRLNKNQLRTVLAMLNDIQMSDTENENAATDSKVA